MGVRERYEQRQKEGKEKEIGHYGVQQRYMAKELDNIASSISNRVNAWLKNHNTYISNYQVRNSGRKYSYEDSYVNDSADWLNKISQQKNSFDTEADSILAYLDQYKDYFNDEWMNSVRSTLTSARNQQNTILANTQKDNEWWSNFKDEEDYSKYQRYDGYSKKYSGQKYDDIQNALAVLEDGEEKDWLSYYQYDLYKDDQNYNSKAASGFKSYEAQKIAEQEAKAEAEANKSWWEKFSDFIIDNQSHNPDNPMVDLIMDQRELYAEDTSWKEPNDAWEDYQKNHFGYLYSINPAKAYDYAAQVNNEINAKAKYEQQQGAGNWASQNFGTGVLGTLGAVASAPFGIGDLMDDLIEYSARGTITQKDYLSPFEMGQAAQSGIANKLNDKSGTIDDDAFIVGGKGLGDVYSLGVSAANSLLSAFAFGGAGTLVNFIGQGGAAGVDDALSRGATAEQALLYGTITGALEGVTEMIPADELLKIGSSSTVKNFLMSAVNQGLGEFIEEGTSSLFGNIADNIIMADKSNFYATVDELMAGGMTEEEAKKAAWKKMAGDIAFDAMGGFATGATNAMTVGGTHNIIDSRKGNKANIDAVKQYGDFTGDLIQEGLQSDVKSESYQLAQKYQKQVQGKDGKGGKALTGFQIRNLVAANEAQFAVEDYDSAVTTAKERLTELGESKDVNKLAKLVAKKATGQELTRSERKVLVNSFGSQVAKEMSTPTVETQSGTKTYNATYKSITERVGEKPNLSVSESGQATVRGTNEALDLAKAEVVTAGDGHMTFKTADGTVVSAEQIDFADDNQSLLVSSVANIENITPAAATAIMHDVVDTSKPLGEQLNGIDEAYTYGYYDYSVADLKAGLHVPNITNEQMMSAYKLGQSARKISDVEADAPVVKMRTAWEAKLTAKQKTEQLKARFESDDVEVYFQDGGTVVKFDEHNAGQYDEKRMAGVNTAKFLSKLGIGGKFYFYESYVNADGQRVYKDANGNEVAAPNGMYKTSDGSIHIDMNAGDNGEGTTLFTLGHEATHFVKQHSKKQFKVLSDLVTEAYGKSDMTMHERVVQKQNQLEKIRGEKVSYDEAFEEVVADSMSTMFADGNIHEKLAELKTKDKGLFKTIKKFFDKLIAKFKEVYATLTPDQKAAQDIRDMKDMFDRIQTAFAKALVEASENFRASEQVLAQAGIEVNAKTDSGSLQSVRDVLSDAERKKVAKALADRFGVTVEEAREWLKAETSLASLILNPKYSAFLDYEADPNEVAIKQNSDYPQGTVDFSNICKKRREFTQVMNRILRNFPNHVFAATDLAKIRTIMGEEGMTLPCGICYVEDRRQLDTIVAQDFINSLKLYREGSKVRPDGKPFNANQLKGLQLTDGDSYVPSIYELVSLEGRNSLKAKNPNMEAAWVRFNNARGMQAVRLLTNEAEYKRQILKYTQKTVQTKNDYGGLRIYSFSDAEMFHLIDIVQVLTDCAAVGLKVQGYTKVNEYAKAVKDTGEKLNRSLIPLGDLGYHMENGKVVLDYDPVEGIDIHSEDFFDSKDNPNVGNIVIGINPTQIRAAMVSDFIDYIIPFHTGQSAEVLGEKGIAAWVNYKDSQSEVDLATGKKSAHQINIYTEVFQAAENEGKPIRNKRDFVNKFLAVCKENGLKPRFAEFLNTDANGDYVYTEGYHKFLVDFKTFAQTEVGEYLPQMPVKPIFDNAYITGLLETYVEEQQVKDAEVAKQMPKVIERITNEIVKPAKDGAKKSDRKWTPSLDSTEWGIVKYAVDNNQGTAITNTCNMFFKKSKGRTLFGIYSTEDSTLLYASRNGMAEKEHIFAKLLREEYENGNVADTSAEGLSAWAKTVRLQSVGNDGHSYGVVAPGRSAENAGLHGRPSRLYASAALRNVLDNILKKETAGRTGDGRVKYSDRDGNTMSDRAKEILASAKPKMIGKNEKADIELDTVRELFNELNADKDIQGLADRVFEVAKEDVYGHYGYASYPGEPKSHLRLPMAFVGKDGIPNGVHGQFRKNTIWGDIVFSYDYFMDESVAPQSKASTILHEVIHAITCIHIESGYRWSQAKQGMFADPLTATDFDGVDERIKAGIELIDVFEQVKYAPTESGKQLYGQLTAYEMVAEMANVEFRNFLKKQNLWNRIVEAIKRIFGIPKTTAYDAVSDALERILTETTSDAEAQRAKMEARKANNRYSDRDSTGKQLTKEQQEFFKDSVVRDADGNLLAVYHGTDADFTVFEANKDITGEKYYFAASRTWVKNLFKEEKYHAPKNIMRVYLNIKNPLDLRSAPYVMTGNEWIDYFDSIGVPISKRFREFWSHPSKNKISFGSGEARGNITPWHIFMFDGISGGLRDTLDSMGYDGLVIYDKVFGKADNTAYVAFHQNQIKLTSNKKPTTDPDTRYSVRSSKVDTDGMSAEAKKIISNLEIRARFSGISKGEYASYSAERIERELSNSSSATQMDYAKSYIAWVNPMDFLYATTTSEAGRAQIEKEAGELDLERLRKQTQPIHLTVDFETGKIVGHEGRHRMTALYKAGVEKVAVIFDAWNDDRYNTKPVAMMRIGGQEFDKYHGGLDFYVHDMLPLSRRYADAARKLFSEVSGSVKFSERTGDSVSNRHLLANAFEGITMNSEEYKMIQEYKDRIKELNALEAKLSNLNAEIRKIRFGTTGARDTQRLAQLESEAKDTAKEINRYDKRLLNLEASEPLRKVIARERKKEAQKTKDHVKEIQQNKKVRAAQAELRHKIRKAVRDLDKLLNRGNKKLNVKEDVQGVVSKALKAADILFTENYGNYDMLRNGIGADLSDAEEALVNTCTQMLKDLDKMPTDGYDSFMARQEAENRLKTKMSKLKDVFARERKRLNNTTVSTILGELADAYATLEKSEQSYVQGAYSEAVHNFLKNLQSEVGGTVVQDMTKDQLENVYAAYKMVLTTVRKANQLFNQGLKMSREQLGNAVINEVMNAGGVHGLWTKAEIARSQFDWNNMKPVWVSNRIGSESFGKLMQGLFEGQYNFAVDIDEAKKFKQEMDKKHKPRSWDAEKQYHFESSTGKEFSLNLQQIMSIYAFSKREQAYSHLLNGGFVFEGNSTVIVDEKGRKKTYIHNGATSYKLNEATLNSIINSLTKEQKAYVDEMQKYLSEVMGEKGNEVSMQLYGIKMFNEQFYFPLRSSGAYMERAKEAEMKKQQGQINLVNSGFTHAVKPQAKNPIILSGFMDVWAEHCNEMSMYHSMVLPMEDFRKVYNYSTVHDDKFDSASVYQTIQDAYGKAATDYIDQLYRELNAGATVDPRETPFKAFISKFKKAAVMMSASVVVQQFSSIGRAYALIDPKYFIGAKVNSNTQLAVVDEMKKYAPVAIIKEMGGFDTGTKGSAKSYIMAETYGKGERIQGLKKDEQYRSDLMGYLPAKADEKTWCAIWEAVKRETKAKHSKMDARSEEFLKLAGERFSEVIEKTQVYDSVLARSANMRSKSAFMAMATAFMAEPTTTVNLIEDAVRSGDKKHMARAFGAVAMSIVLNNALSSIVYAMRDDDEDETFIEKYFQSFTSGMIDDLNPMSYYPFLKDVYSLFQGFDVERADMSVIADVRDALKKAISVIGKDTSEMDDAELAEHYKNVNGALMSMLDAGCSMFGVPFKNVRRDANGLINAFVTAGKDLTERDTTWRSFWDKVGTAAKDALPILAWTKDKAKVDKLYDAIVIGDKSYLARLKSAYKDESAYQSAVRKALRENDQRIHAAAQARYDGNTEEYKRIFKEIQKEGKFSFDDIMSAVNSELSAIKGKQGPDKVTSQYSTSGFVEAVAMGNATEAQTMRNDIIATHVANGKTQEEAEKAFASAVATGVREAFSAGLLDEAGAEKMLLEYAGKDEEEAASKVSYWAFCEEHPEYDLTESNVKDYREFAEPAEIPLDVFAQYLEGTKGLSTKYDEWGDVEVTKKEQVLEVINSLPLTWQQKDTLYLAAGYSESQIWDVPW